MKGFTKKIMAGTLAASLVMGSSLVAFAEDPAAPAGTGTSEGSGTVEGIVETDVYNAVLPTASETAYDYIADPQGLIRKTDAANHSGATFGDGTVFFKNVNGDTTSYSNTSDAATITNKSSKNLSVTVTATATPDSADGAAGIATSKTFESDNTSLEVYLGITDSVTGSTEKALTAAGVEMTAVLGAAPEEAYEYKYDSTNSKYEYALKSDVSSFVFADYSFQINGAANTNAEWKEDTAVPAVSIKWDVDLTDTAATVETPEQTPEEPAIALSGTYSRENTANTFSMTGLGTATVTKVEALNAEGEVFAAINSPVYSVSGSTLTINGTTAPWGAGAVGASRGIKVTLSNGKTIQTTFTVNQ